LLTPSETFLLQMVANFFFGIGSMIIFAMATTMLTEFMPGKASTGIAVNNFIRNIFSCVGGIVAAPLIDAIGNGWLCTIFGLVSLISGCGVILSMKRYSARWRVDMDRRMKD
jgi:MFS family permease